MFRKKVEVNDFNNHRVFKAKLPSINLPSFGGSYDSWLSFHDLFKSLVHKDTELANIEKLYRLKGCLKSEAADIIESLEISSDNYLVAWDLLKKRYDNRKVIREGHASALLKLPKISKEYLIRTLVDQLQRHVRALQSLNELVEA